MLTEYISIWIERFKYLRARISPVVVRLVHLETCTCETPHGDIMLMPMDVRFRPFIRSSRLVSHFPGASYGWIW